MSTNKPIPGMGSANFANVFDLSTLKKPTGEVVTPTHGKQVTQENLVSDFVAKSKELVVILLAWSVRSAQAKEILESLGKLEIADKNEHFTKKTSEWWDTTHRKHYNRKR